MNDRYGFSINFDLNCGPLEEILSVHVPMNAHVHICTCM